MRMRSKAQGARSISHQPPAFLLSWLFLWKLVEGGEAVTKKGFGVWAQPGWQSPDLRHVELPISWQFLCSDPIWSCTT